jgi:long-chain acyl-CoA synthetase
LKDVIVTGGENVYCGEVEAVIFGHSGGPRGGSLRHPGSALGELVDASVVLKPGMNITEEALSVTVARASRITKFPMWSSRRLIYRNVALANY